jgi:hypothetical protein
MGQRRCTLVGMPLRPRYCASLCNNGAQASSQDRRLPVYAAVAWLNSPGSTMSEVIDSVSVLLKERAVMENLQQMQ